MTARTLICLAALLLDLHADADPLTEINRSMDKVIYRIDPCVFSSSGFPSGVLQHADKIGPVTSEVTFYNEKFEAVKTAETTGRYGAVVRITLPGGVPAARFISLYRAPREAFWQTFGKLELPIVSGNSPGTERTQLDIVGTALIGGLVDGTHKEFVPTIMRALAKVVPGIGIENIFYDFKLRDDAWWFELRKRIGLPVTYVHITKLPDDYESNPAKRWPLILFLHGTGERGDDIETLNQKSIPLEIARGRKIPAIVLWPQCSKSESWSAPALSQLIDDVSAQYRVDPERVIITGQSAGGLGTWSLAASYPDRFAAIAPICGFCSPAEAAKLKTLPVWVFHGDKDTLVPLSLSQKMVAALQAAGGSAHLTIYPGVGHEAWVRAYPTDALYTWMLAQKRGQPEVKTPGIPMP